eukprot:8003646-Pyramimonas_sp.AAC.1
MARGASLASGVRRPRRTRPPRHPMRRGSTKLEARRMMARARTGEPSSSQRWVARMRPPPRSPRGRLRH